MVEEETGDSGGKGRTLQRGKGRSDLSFGIFSGYKIKQKFMPLQRKQIS